MKEKHNNEEVGRLMKDDFWKHYKETSTRVIPRVLYNKILKDLLMTSSSNIITKNETLKILGVGRIRIRVCKMTLLNKKGELGKLKVNWGETLKYWNTKYPGLSKEELKATKNKTLIYHTNEHSNGEFAEHYWDNKTTPLRHKKFYKFKASRQYSRLLAKTMKDVNKTVFYYG